MPNLLHESQGGLHLVTVDRPRVLNALDAATLAELEALLGTLAAAPPADVRCLILTGAGDKAFVAGADIAAMASMPARDANAFSERGHRVMALLGALPAPVIAAVNGYALGGGLELALACDVILASSAAKLGLPEVGLGVITGFGGIQRLARRVGPGHAARLAFSGATVGAEEAHRLGLVDEVTAPADLMARARALAEAICARAPLAVADAKRALRAGAEQPLAAALAFERELFAGLFATADQREGMAAFLEKRQPRFSGR